MWVPSLIVLTIQVLTLTQQVLAKEPKQIRMCTYNETITINLLRGSDHCNCRVSPKEASERDDYIHYPGVGSFKIFPEAKNWNDARRACLEDDAHLAIINSKAEEEVSLMKIQQGRSDRYTNRYH